MGSFITLDTHELLYGELSIRESGGSEIALFKLGKSLGIKLGLELFQDIREFYAIELKVSPGRLRSMKHKGGTKLRENKRNKRVRTEDQEVCRIISFLPRGSSRKKWGSENEDRGKETHCVNQ